MILKIQEIKQLILNNSATDITADSGVVLLTKRIFYITTSSIITSVHIFICVICPEICFYLVCALFSNSINTTTSKSTLANIIRRNYDLNFLNSIHRNRICRCLTTICTRSSKTKNIVLNSSIYLETVILIIRTCKRHTTKLILVSHRHILYNIINVSINCCCAFNCIHIKVMRSSSLLPLTLTGNNNFSKILRSISHRTIQLISVTKLKIDISTLRCLITHIRNSHRVRTARSHTLNGITAIQISHCVVLSSRRIVQCRNRCADHCLLVLVCHNT